MRRMKMLRAQRLGTGIVGWHTPQDNTARLSWSRGGAHW